MPAPFASRRRLCVNSGPHGAITVDWNDITGAPASFPPNGPAGGDLTGTFPSPSVRPGAVTTDRLSDSAVTSRQLADGAVTPTKLANQTVAAPHLANAAVTTDKL